MCLETCLTIDQVELACRRPSPVGKEVKITDEKCATPQRHYFPWPTRVRCSHQSSCFSCLLAHAGILDARRLKFTEVVEETTSDLQ